ncbi:MAG: RNA methyltransferase [Kaiparowitsia implicata GSE-PSE-MK54-09C]|nr:RNA methyltransferase [Kaiparowitsia implicata GSE-PSE-MK54-09C]
MLTSLQNPLVKRMRKLHRARERYKQAAFLLEGTHLLDEATAMGVTLEVVCYTELWRDRHPQLWLQVSSLARRLELVSAEVIGAIATTVNPDGVVAIAPRHHQQPLPPQVSLGVALETIQDPGNLGTIIRTAAAVGGDGLWLSANSVDLDHPKVLRASAGQWFRMPMACSEHLHSDLATLQTHGVQVVTTRADAPCCYWDVDFTRPSVIVLGNEGAGLSPDLAAIADVAVHIPQAPAVESLNVAIAAALLLYEAKRQRAK